MDLKNVVCWPTSVSHLHPLYSFPLKYLHVDPVVQCRIAQEHFICVLKVAEVLPLFFGYRYVGVVTIFPRMKWIISTTTLVCDLLKKTNEIKIEVQIKYFVYEKLAYPFYCDKTKDYLQLIYTWQQWLVNKLWPGNRVSNRCSTIVLVLNI